MDNFIAETSQNPMARLLCAVLDGESQPLCVLRAFICDKLVLWEEGWLDYYLLFVC